MMMKSLSKVFHLLVWWSKKQKTNKTFCFSLFFFGSINISGQSNDHYQKIQLAMVKFVHRAHQCMEHGSSFHMKKNEKCMSTQMCSKQTMFVAVLDYFIVNREFIFFFRFHLLLVYLVLLFCCCSVHFLFFL